MSVASFEDKPKAEEVRNRLEQAGIHAEVYDESKIQKYWFLSEPHASEKVRVNEEDFEKAREVLKAFDGNDTPCGGAVRCPECSSCRVEYPQFTRKFITPTLIEIFTVMAPGMKRRFYCEDCHATWAREPEAPTEAWGGDEIDPLGWPRKKEQQVK
ncbi:MAG: DUF2007 domain-containing protein [Verrucomicrobia bacterium]|nr:DUF2007 domain-containing protein [Verrucomicrobiota bacterium]